MIKLHCKLKFKYKKKRYKTFNIKINNKTFFFFLDLKDKEKVNNEIVTLFKKTVSKMLKSKWIVDLKFFLYIIN